jgi:hypothetical protein
VLCGVLCGGRERVGKKRKRFGVWVWGCRNYREGLSVLALFTAKNRQTKVPPLNKGGYDSVTSSVSAFCKILIGNFRCLAERDIFFFFGFLGLFSGVSVFSRFFNRVHPKGGGSRYEGNIQNLSVETQLGACEAQDDNAESKHNNVPLFYSILRGYCK